MQIKKEKDLKNISVSLNKNEFENYVAKLLMNINDHNGIIFVKLLSNNKSKSSFLIIELKKNSDLTTTVIIKCCNFNVSSTKENESEAKSDAIKKLMQKFKSNEFYMIILSKFFKFKIKT